MSDDSLNLRALLIADRIETRGLTRAEDDTGVDPIAMRWGAGHAFVFRHGVVAFAGLTPAEEALLLETLKPRLTRALVAPASEDVVLTVRDTGEDLGLSEGAIVIRQIDLPRLTVVADVLAKAAVLNRLEETIQGALDRVEPFAEVLAREGKPGVGRQELAQRMGEALLAQLRMTGRIAVADKPEILWDHPELERLYARLEAEYELTERADAVERKLELLRTTTEVTTDLIQNQSALHLEWIIILLIAFEIFLTLFNMATGRPH